MRLRCNFLLVAALLVSSAASLFAQDTRTVTEPKIPLVCTTLHATRFATTDRKLSAEGTIDTASIQSALDHCKPGMAVELTRSLPVERTNHCDPNGLCTQTGPRVVTGTAFLSGSLELREGVTLLLDKGVTLYGSRDPKDYDPDPKGSGPLLCGTLSSISRVYVTAKEAAATGKTAPPPPQAGRPCKALININVKNAAIMGEGTIDGRGDAQLIGHDYSWWQMARQAEPKQLAYYSTRLISASHADGLILYGIHLNNAPNCHVCVTNTNGFTAWGVHLQTPTVKGTDARNTDGIDPGNSTNVTVANSWIDNGDDNIAIKANVQHMSVLNNHFYDGHGMSLGSEVANDAYILVDGLTEDHTTSGIRVKSNNTKGGPVHDLTFRNICMTGVKMPIAISPYYNNGTTEGFTDPNIAGEHVPDYKKIKLANILAETPGDVLIAGKDDAHRTQVNLVEVDIHGIQPAQVHLAYADINAADSNIPLQGAGKTVHVLTDGIISYPFPSKPPNLPAICSAKFVPYQ